MPIAFSMQALVDDINKCKDKIKKSKKDTFEYDAFLQSREEERQEESKKNFKERRKGLKMFFGDVHTFLNQVKEEMGEARNLWNSLGQKRKSKR